MKQGKLFIHIGTHKTGSTSIQQALRKFNSQYVNYLEYYPYKWWYDGLLYGSWKVRGIILESIETYPVTIISYEELSGHWPSGYSDTKERAGILSLLTRGIDTTIIVYLRNRNEFIESMWKQSIKQGNKCSLKDFILINKNRFNWEELTLIYSKYFQSIIIRDYNDRIVQDFADLMNINLDYSIRANKSYGPIKLKIARAIFPYVTGKKRAAIRKLLR